MTFKEFINEEKFKILGKIKPFEKVLYNNFIEFLNNEHNKNIKIELKIIKPSHSHAFGFIDFHSIIKKKYRIQVEYQLAGLLKRIAHEYIHIVQIIDKKLEISEDLFYLKWNNIQYSIEEYKNISDYSEHKKMPWEKEAYKQQDILFEKYLKSEYFDKIKNDPNIDFLYNNDALS